METHTPPSPMQPYMRLHDVVRTFSLKSGLLGSGTAQVRAVNGVSLDIRTGETLGLVGESGCGKSTLARMAVGLLPPSSGTILLENKALELWPGPERAARIQMVFQDPFSSLNPRLSIGASIAEPLLLSLRHQGGRPDTAFLRQQVEQMLVKVGLDPAYYSRYPHEFSGGQRQRIAVARALIAGASFLVCDEPVSALDASVQAQVLNLLKDMQEESGLTYLFISHDLGVVGFMSDRVAVMYLGKVVELADRESLFTHPAHPYTQALLEAIPARGGTGSSAPVLLQGELPSPLAPPAGCAFHPRCPKAQAHCTQYTPEEVEHRPGQWVRCFFPL